MELKLSFNLGLCLHLGTSEKVKGAGVMPLGLCSGE